MKINHPPTPEYLDLEDHVANQKPIPKGCRHYRLRIDRHKHKWNSDRITGRDTLDLAGKVDFDKFQVNQHFRFNRVEQVQLDEIVDLAASGVERFVIVPATKAEITIIVNGRPRQVDKEELTYEEVVLLAYPNATFGASIIYTVTYQRAADECKPSGQLVPSSAAVTIKEKTKFDVSRTDKS
jgi:hypothetical protein